MQKSIVIAIIAAVCLMVGCTGNKAQMLQLLEELEATNRAGKELLNDSLAEELVDYFDRHGSSNERMRSRYMLGRTYYFMDELPRALDMYNEAAACADTTSVDCDYKVLSRIHAQKAAIFNMQIQPRSQLSELRLAEYYAWKGKDTLQAIECFAQQAEAYDFLSMYDSVVIIREKAYDKYIEVNRAERAAQTLGSAVPSLLELHDLSKARLFIDLFEAKSELFDESGNIEKGREVYYYAKGKYYLAVNDLDSAEYMFRKELRDGKDLNNQIAGSKGLQEVFERKAISDSIAKYANRGYVLNDSAYSLSEMQNIQRLSVSYNYQHNKELIKEQEQSIERAHLIIVLVIALLIAVVFISLFFTNQLKKKKNNELRQFIQDKHELESAKLELEELLSSEQQASEEQIAMKDKEIAELQHKVTASQYIYERRLAQLESNIDGHDLIRKLHRKAETSPYENASSDDFRNLCSLMNDLIPGFYATFHHPACSLREIEYRVCMLVRFHFKSAEISKLTNTSDAYVANLKKRIFLKVYGVAGVPKDLDEQIMSIQ